MLERHRGTSWATIGPSSRQEPLTLQCAKQIVRTAIFIAACVICLIGALIACGCDYVNATTQTTAVQGEIKVRYLDVGQGDATLISCNGHHLLIDGGPVSASSKIYSILDALDITELDAIIATHPDVDHIGGISGALNHATAAAYYCSTNENEAKAFSIMKEQIEKAGGTLTVPTAGQSFALGDAIVTFIGPVETFDSDNDQSLIVRIDFGSSSFLFTGDAEQAAESSLVNAKAKLSADVLQVGHHGSSTSTTEAFLKAVKPKYAVISVGENEYGHPHQSVLNRLEKAGVETLRTDTAGNVVFASDGTTISYTTTNWISD